MSRLTFTFRHVTRRRRVQVEGRVLQAVVGKLQCESGHVRGRLVVATAVAAVCRRRRLLTHQDDLLVRGGPFQHEGDSRRGVRRLLLLLPPLLLGRSGRCRRDCDELLEGLSLLGVVGDAALGQVQPPASEDGSTNSLGGERFFGQS